MYQHLHLMIYQSLPSTYLYLNYPSISPSFIYQSYFFLYIYFHLNIYLFSREYMSRLELDKKMMRDSTSSDTVHPHINKEERCSKVSYLVSFLEDLGDVSHLYNKLFCTLSHIKCLISNGVKRGFSLVYNKL